MNEKTNFELRLQVPEEQIRRLFSQIEEYQDLSILDVDLLIRGMAYKASHSIGGVDPNGKTVVVTPLDLFVTELIKMAVEAKSTGVTSRT